MNDKIDAFKAELEKVLDEQFPKIEEEGEAKRLNRRGAALVLYARAVNLFREYCVKENL